MCARADVDIILRRERGARGGAVCGVTGGVCRLRRREIVAHIAVMMMVGGQGNRLHGFITGRRSTSGAVVVGISKPAS